MHALTPLLHKWAFLLALTLLLGGCGGGGSDSNGGGASPEPAPPAAPIYSLSYSAEEGGSLEGRTEQSLEAGVHSSPVTAVPDEGHHFVGWSDGWGDNPRVDTDIAGDLSVSARFVPNQYALSYKAGEHGQLGGDTEQQVNHGADGQAVSALPRDGYEFVSWSDGSTENPRTDIDVTESLVLTATFEPREYSLNYSAEEGGHLEGEAHQHIVYGSDGSAITAVATEGYHFVDWSDDREENPRTDADITANLSASARFAPNEYTLSYSAGEGGSLVGNTVQHIPHGSAGSEMTAVPSEGHYFIGWSDGNTGNPRNDVYVSGDLDVTARFAANVYTLTYRAGENGRLEGRTSQESSHGSNGDQVTAIADEGYQFVSWSDGDASNPRTDTGVVESFTVTANFTINEYTLSYSADEGGSLDGQSTQRVVHGSDGSAITAVAEEGYYFVRWSDGRTDNPRFDSGIAENLEVTASFAINEYTLSYNAGENGHLDGPVLQERSHGSSGDPVIAVPEEGYNFVGWTDGRTDSPRTDTHVTDNLRVTAQFWRLEHYGDLQVTSIERQSATLDWPSLSGESYNLIISQNREIDLANYAAYDATLELNVTPPFELSDLETDTPIFVALEANNTISAWSSFTPRKLDPMRMANVAALAMDVDGTQYIGGDFKNVVHPTGSAVGLPLATTLADHALAGPNVNGRVNVSVPDGKGGWYIGGQFTLVGGERRQSLAQIDRLGRVTRWSPEVKKWGEVPGVVWTIALKEDVVYVGGEFANASGHLQANLAAFSTDGDLLPQDLAAGGALAVVNSLAIDDNVIYAGGRFSSVAGEPRSSLAAFNTQGDLLPWNPGTDGIVNSLVIDDGVIYAGGWFSSAGGQNRESLAAFGTGGGVLPWNPGSNNGVNSLAVDDGVIYAGGRFSRAGGESRENLAAFNTEGDLLPWNPGAGDTVNSVAVDNGVIYAGGGFRSAGGKSREYLAAFCAEGDLLPWNPTADGRVNDLSVSDGLVRAGGYFTGMGGEPRSYLAAIAATGDLLSWDPGTDGKVRSLVVDEDAIYAGGVFRNAGGEPRSRLAAFNTEGDLLPWDPKVNSWVNSLAIYDSVIYVGGWFTSAGEEPRSRLAAFDTEGDLVPWSPGADNRVKSLVIDGGVIYAGGEFDIAGGEPRGRLAAFNSEGELLPWNPSASSSVFALASNDGIIYAGGWFVTAGGERRERLAAFDTEGNLLSWNPGANEEVLNLVIKEGAIYARGWFRLAGGEPRMYLAQFDLEGTLLDR